MRVEMLSDLNRIHSGIISLEVMVHELVRAAEVAPADAADILLAFARGDRVKILEMQGQFAALKKVYSERYHREA